MPVQPHPAGPSPPAGDSNPSGRKIGFIGTLLASTVATLIVVVGVVVIGAADEMWILAPLMLVVVVLSTAIFTVIGWMLNDMGD